MFFIAVLMSLSTISFISQDASALEQQAFVDDGDVSMNDSELRGEIVRLIEEDKQRKTTQREIYERKVLAIDKIKLWSESAVKTIGLLLATMAFVVSVGVIAILVEERRCKLE